VTCSRTMAHVATRQRARRATQEGVWFYATVCHASECGDAIKSCSRLVDEKVETTTMRERERVVWRWFSAPPHMERSRMRPVTKHSPPYLRIGGGSSGTPVNDTTRQHPYKGPSSLARPGVLGCRCRVSTRDGIPFTCLPPAGGRSSVGIRTIAGPSSVVIRTCSSTSHSTLT
jgi:hypothetical protein